MKRKKWCVCSPKGATMCQGPQAHTVPQPQLTPASFSCPPSLDGYHTTVHQTFSFTSTSCHCSLSLSHPLCNYKVAEAVSPVRQRLAAWHWESQRKRVPVIPCTSAHSCCWWARRRGCQRWWLCSRVSTWAVSFPVHHCAGEADDWIQSVRWLMRAPLDLGQPINHVIRANVPWKRQTSAKE